MQYIRFLKSPCFKPGRRGGSISALITVTSDLGDFFMPRDSPIIGRVTDENGNIIARKTFQWLAGMRALKIDIDVNSQGDNVVLQVSSRNPADNLLKDSDDAILSVWSPPFVLNKNFQIDGLVERRLGIGHERVLSIWEEPGESIARHIWYAPDGVCDATASPG
jgi:hypothetical protein